MEIHACTQCGKGLLFCEIEKVVCVCVNPACPNYSLLCLPEKTIENFMRGFDSVKKSKKGNKK